MERGMIVEFIYLPHPYLKQPNAQAPLGLMYLASILKKPSIEVKIHNFSSLYTYEAINKLPEADLYGITVTSLELPQANRFAYLIKEKYPNSKIILGGPGTITPEFVDWNIIDSICIGDGEIAIQKILNDFPNLKKEYWGTAVEDINSIPFPARYLLKDSLGGNIFAYNKNYKKGGSTVIITSRGCPMNCAYCTSPKLRKICGNKVRFRSPENVYKEIKQIIKDYGIRQFRFSDDMFTANRKRAIEICELIGTLNIIWRVSCRVNPFDEELAQIMYDAGCIEMSFGVESFDNHVLKILNKKATAKDNVKALEICNKIGIKARVLFMIRTPGQTKKTVPINIKWLERVPYNIICCTSFVPIPGSHIWDYPEEYDIEILNKNLDDYNFYFYSSHGENEIKDIIKLKGRTLEELNKETKEFREYLKSTGKLNKG